MCPVDMRSRAQQERRSSIANPSRPWPLTADVSIPIPTPVFRGLIPVPAPCQTRLLEYPVPLLRKERWIKCGCDSRTPRQLSSNIQSPDLVVRALPRELNPLRLKATGSGKAVTGQKSKVDTQSLDAERASTPRINPLGDLAREELPATLYSKNDLLYCSTERCWRSCAAVETIVKKTGTACIAIPVPLKRRCVSYRSRGS